MKFEINVFNLLMIKGNNIRFINIYTNLFLDNSYKLSMKFKNKFGWRFTKLIKISTRINRIKL